ncbi:hypothetical protein R1flu_014973 [Riccia fluitans]|uniref:Uncharacterized protein n=1 Tax=Riccia fluitans TaxID=41844 RepID=A0ABD1YHR2_9MARC
MAKQATMLAVNANPKVVANNSSRCINNLNSNINSLINNINSLNNNNMNLSKVNMCMVFAITASNEITRLEIVRRSKLTCKMANNLIQRMRKKSC